jgi:hypothetical protein
MIEVEGTPSAARKLAIAPAQGLPGGPPLRTICLKPSAFHARPVETLRH